MANFTIADIKALREQLGTGNGRHQEGARRG